MSVKKLLNIIRNPYTIEKIESRKLVTSAKNVSAIVLARSEGI